MQNMKKLQTFYHNMTQQTSHLKLHGTHASSKRQAQATGTTQLSVPMQRLSPVTMTHYHHHQHQNLAPNPPVSQTQHLQAWVVRMHLLLVTVP